jgi:UDP-N-acetylmuramoyl-L-alanyl-D-glutamate--2,6-diaminopimelate ligase
VFAENALGAACAALAAGIDPAHVRSGLAACPIVPGRFEVLSTAPVVVVIDYAHSPDALARTCETARALANGQRVLVVFGAGGGTADKSKREPMGRAVGERADQAIVTSDNPRDEDPAAIARSVAAGCRRGGRAYVAIELDRRRAIARALEVAKPGDVVVVAGKGHERGQIIGTETLPFSDVDEVGALLGKSAGS